MDRHKQQDVQRGSEAAYLTQRELARRWRISGRTLERWRADGYGPAWYHLGGSIRYRLDEIATFETQQRRKSVASEFTVEVGGGAR